MKIFATKQYILTRLEQEGFVKEASVLRDKLQKEAVMGESKLNEILRMDVSELPSAIRDKVIQWIADLGWFSGEKSEKVIETDLSPQALNVASKLEQMLDRNKGLADPERIRLINKFFINNNIEHMQHPILRHLRNKGRKDV